MQLESTLGTDIPTNRHDGVALTNFIIIIGAEADALKGDRLHRFLDICPAVGPVLNALARCTTVKRVQFNL